MKSVEQAMAACFTLAYIVALVFAISAVLPKRAKGGK